MTPKQTRYALFFLLWLGWPLRVSAEIGEIDVNVPTTEKQAPPVPEDHSTLWIRSGTRIYLMMTDAKGKKAGVDSKTKKTFQDIAHSQCDADFIENKYTNELDELHETITLEPAAQGAYTFRVTGLQPGPYLITLSALGRGGSSLPSKEVEGLISEGEVKVFTLNFQPETSNALSVIEEHKPAH